MRAGDLIEVTSVVAILTRLNPQYHIGAALVALVPLLYVYMPRPPVNAARLVVFPIIGAILSIVVACFVVRREPIDRQTRAVLLLLLALSVATSLSFLVNASEIRGTAVLELLRPALLCIFLLFGYYVAYAYGEDSIRRGLLYAAYVILIGQLVIATAQILGIASVGLVYREEHTRPLGTLLRATGSLGNPTIFGWVVAQAAAIIYAFNRRGFLPWFLLGGLLVLASGSRSMVLLFPFVIAVMALFSRTAGKGSFGRAAGIGILTLAGLLACVFWFSDVFRYLGQLRRIVELGSLTSISSLASRFAKWQYRYDVFTDGGILAWVLGLGSRDLMRIVDNDYLYVLFRLGVVGLVVHWATLLYAAWVLRRARDHRIAGIGMQYLVSTIPLSLLFEALGGWNFPLLFFYYLGLSIGVARWVQRQEWVDRQAHSHLASRTRAWT